MKTYKHIKEGWIAYEEGNIYTFDDGRFSLPQTMVENSSDREPVEEECPEWIKKCIRDIEEVGENGDEATFIRILKSNAPKQKIFTEQYVKKRVEKNGDEFSGETLEFLEDHGLLSSDE